MSSIKRPETKLVPVPSVNKIPERDVDKSPILEAQHLGIDFGGLTAVNEFNMAIGRTEIAGLIGPNGAGKTTVFNLLTKVYHRALGTNPSLLLLDEPAAGMNPSETAELMENIVKIRDTFQIAILLIEHDMNLVMGICEGICVLNFGQIIAKGTPTEIQNNPEVIKAYLGGGKEG